MAVTYTLRYRPVGTEAWTELTGLAGTSHALTGLSPGVRYDVEVVAVSDGGASSASIVAQRSTRCAAPAQPTVLPAGYALSSSDPGTNGGLHATWSAVAGAVSYVVRTRPTGVGDYTAVGDPVVGLGATVSGLDGTASYDVEVAAVNVDGDVSAASTSRTAVPARIASGGTVTTFAGDGTIGDSDRTYVVHTFTTAGAATFTLNRDLVVSHLVVAGGGGGGYGFDGGPGGGGGAGGLITGSSTRTAGALAVTVGAGGAGGVLAAGTAGADSILGGITAVGGGAGGASRADGGAGGSGGGGGGRPFVQDFRGGAATVGQGNAGAGNAGTTGAGGGGGAGGAAVAPTTTAGGAGGAGATSSITGSSLTYATGGDGGSRTAQSNGVAAASGRGDGGAGGSSNAIGNVVGGAGGSGVVVLRYALPVLADLTAPSEVAVLPAGRTGGAATGAVEVTWASVGVGATYEVRYRPITPTVGSWTTVGAGATTRRVVTGLDPDRTYEATVSATVDGTSSQTSQPVSAGTVIATGGTVSTFTGNGATDGTLTNADGVTYVVHSFTSIGSATFALNRSIDVEHLVIAGGGGGGSRHGGGGGAGGMSSGGPTARGADGRTTLLPVVVGTGGAGTPEHVHGASVLPTEGSDSSAVGVTADGGGSGGGSARGSGTSGGSGGGSSYDGSDPGSGTSGQGSGGGRGTTTSPWAGGGGGGASGAGQRPSGQVAGAGGAGRSTVIAGNTGQTLAGGGGGSTSNGSAAGAGGSGGGGAGAFGGTAGSDATASTGGGGGGGGFDDSQSPNNKKGGDGASGRVVLRYRLPT